MPATATINTWGIQAESEQASEGRLTATILLGEGVKDKAAGSYQVLQDTGANMAVRVGSGSQFDRAVVGGDSAGQGTYPLEHANATQALSVAASHATLDRIDGVDLRVYDDTFDSSGNSYADLEVTQGTAAGSPVAPAIPSSAIRLATILVQAAVTAIVNGDITDTRVEALIPEPALDLETRLGQWQTWVPTYANLTVGDGTVSARYTQVGKMVVAHFRLTLGSTSSIGTAPTVSLPVTAASRADGFPIGTATYIDAATQEYLGVVVQKSTTTAEPWIGEAGGTYVSANPISATVPITWTTSDIVEFDATYEVA